MYSALAKFYDSFMDVPYASWLDFIVAELGENLKSGIDLGCGTGEVTIGLKQRGYDVCGVDYSVEMLNLACSKAERNGADILWLQGDINKFKFLHKVQFVTAMCDTINYALKPANVFKNVYDNLCDGGKFIFDISSEYKMKYILDGNTYSDNKDDITYIWQNCLSGNRMYMDLTFFEPKNGLYEKTSEQSVQYMHTTDSIITGLSSVGFSVKSYSGVSKKTVRKESQRIFFVAQKVAELDKVKTIK